MAAYNRGKGKGIAFILAHVNHVGDACLIWPFGRDRFGYPVFGLNGKIYKGHRYMCEMVNGPPPTPEHHAAHSCGGGRNGCIHPQHVRWATAKENAIETGAMGMCKPKGAPKRKLTQEQVAEINALKGQKTSYEIAKLFAISPKTVSHIHTGRLWGADKRKEYLFSDDEVRAIRQIQPGELTEAARKFGCNPNSVWRIRRRQTYKHVTD